MRKSIACIALFAAQMSIGLTTGSASADVITPVAVGLADGSDFIGIAAAFDSQPMTEPTAGDTAAAGGSAVSLFNGRTGYMDFGADFADFSIEGTFELLKQFGSNSTMQTTFFWSDDTELGNADDVAAPNFGFGSAFVADGDKQWISRYTGPAVTPEARYLLIDVSDTGSASNRSLEWVFVGTTGAVPEPGSLTLAGLGLTALLGRARRR